MRSASFLGRFFRARGVAAQRPGAGGHPAAARAAPVPADGVPGRRAGDGWCLGAEGWKEALADGMAPPVKLAGTHAKMLEYVTLDALKAYAVDVS